MMLLDRENFLFFLLFVVSAIAITTSIQRCEYDDSSLTDSEETESESETESETETTSEVSSATTQANAITTSKKPCQRWHHECKKNEDCCQEQPDGEPLKKGQIRCLMFLRQLHCQCLFRSNQETGLLPTKCVEPEDCCSEICDNKGMCAKAVPGQLCRNNTDCILNKCEKCTTPETTSSKCCAE